jgi:hypothetical protein
VGKGGFEEAEAEAVAGVGGRLEEMRVWARERSAPHWMVRWV